MSRIDHRPLRSLVATRRAFATVQNHSHAPPPPPIWDTFTYTPSNPSPGRVPRRSDRQSPAPAAAARHGASPLATSSRVTLDHFQTILNLQRPPQPSFPDPDPSAASAAQALGITGAQWQWPAGGVDDTGRSIDTLLVPIGDWSGAGQALDFASDDELVQALLVSPRSEGDNYKLGKDKTIQARAGDWHLTLDPALAYLALRSRHSYGGFLASVRPFIRTLYPTLCAGGAHQIFVSDLLLRHPDRSMLAQVLEMDAMQQGSAKLRASLVCSVYTTLRPPPTQDQSVQAGLARGTPPWSAAANVAVCRAMVATSNWAGLETAWQDLHDTSTYTPESNYLLLRLVLDLLPHRSDRAMALFSVLVTATAPSAWAHWGDEDVHAERRLPMGVLSRVDPAHPRASEILVRTAMVRACLAWKLYVRAQHELEGLLGVVGGYTGKAASAAKASALDLLWEVCRGSIASADADAMDWVRRSMIAMVKNDGAAGVPAEIVDAYVKVKGEILNTDGTRSELLAFYTSLEPAQLGILSPRSLLRIAECGASADMLLGLANLLSQHPVETRSAVVPRFMRALLAAASGEETNDDNVSPCVAAALALFGSSRAILSSADLAHVARFLRPHKDLAKQVIRAQERRLVYLVRALRRRATSGVHPRARVALAEAWLLHNEMGEAKGELAYIRTGRVVDVDVPGPKLREVDGQGDGSSAGEETCDGMSAKEKREARKEAALMEGLKDEVRLVLMRSPEVARGLRRAMESLGLGWALPEASAAVS